MVWHETEVNQKRGLPSTRRQAGINMLQVLSGTTAQEDSGNMRTDRQRATSSKTLQKPFDLGCRMLKPPTATEVNMNHLDGPDRPPNAATPSLTLAVATALRTLARGTDIICRMTRGGGEKCMRTATARPGALPGAAGIVRAGKVSVSRARVFKLVEGSCCGRRRALQVPRRMQPQSGGGGRG